MRILSLFPLLAVPFSICCGSASMAGGEETDGWQERPVRTEISPEFQRSTDGESETEVLVIKAGDVVGTTGAWVKRFPVKGGHYYKFSALRKTTNVKSPRSSTPAKITWQNDKGQLVQSYSDDLARPEYPGDGPMSADRWQIIAAVYRVPRETSFALVELHLRWSNNSEVQWRDISLMETTKPESYSHRVLEGAPSRNRLSSAGNRSAFPRYLATRCSRHDDGDIDLDDADCTACPDPDPECCSGGQ